MKRLLTILSVLLYFSLIGASAAAADDGALQKGGQSFTDNDLEQYKSPSDNKVPETEGITGMEKKMEKTQRLREQHEREYWCKRASPLKKNVERARDDVTETEKELSEYEGSVVGKPKNTLRKKLERARKQLKIYERDLNDLEAEAHRKDIPPGWLRCQFE